MNSKKIAICLPSYNECENIEKVTKIVDDALKKYTDYKTIIVNADSGSTDNTNEKFSNFKTVCEKHSLLSKEKGKGINLLNFFKYCDNINVDYALCLDSDLKSLTVSWIDKMLYELLDNKMDYVVPIYKRSRFEGSTTNHFAFPFVYAMTGYYVRQPIAGDFGFNKKFINSVIKQKTNYSISQYGIDIFMTLTACNNNLRIKQIKLDKKIHAPSCNKIENMFLEVLDAALFFCKNNNMKYTKQNINIETNILKSRNFKHKEYAVELKNKYFIKNIDIENEWINVMKNIINNYNKITKKDYEYIQKIFINRAVDYWFKSQKYSAYKCETLLYEQCMKIVGG